MDAAKGVFDTVTGVAGPIFHTAGSIFSAAGETLSKMGTTIFVLGFIGILLTFLWFLFRYLDKKRLALPTVIFVFFFFVFLSGNLLLIAQDAGTESPPEPRTVGAEISPAETPSGGETLV